MSPTDALPRFGAPLSRTRPLNPPVEYAIWRAEGVRRVALPDGDWAWAITGHAAARTALADPRLSSDRRLPGFPRFTGVLPAPGEVPPMIALDGAEHRAARGPVIGEFTVRRVAALRPAVQRIVDERVNALLGAARPVDLVRAFAQPVSSEVICDLLGVPFTDHEFFERCTSVLTSRAATEPQRRAAQDDLTAYFDLLVADAEREPGDDLIGRQIRRRRERGGSDHAALVRLVRVLVLAGHETTANMISLGALILAGDGERRRRFLRDPADPRPVEELLRFLTITDFITSRVATADVRVDGVLICAGDPVVVLTAAANHDPEVFADPGELDLARDSRHHLAFGYGPHQCLGQHLARLQLRVALGTLFDRIPGLRPAVPVDALPFKDDAAIYGLYELPVTW
jgi:cytochrome P450